jgi:glycosyltransferase involved in cell wall biosynthesis
VSDRRAVKLSVIMPCLDAAATVAVQLEALAGQKWTEEWELIVVDNGSTDETFEIVESYRPRFPNLRVLDASTRRGQAHALNAGARAAQGEAITFCDADDEVGPGWLAAMGDALERSEFVAGWGDSEKLNEPWLRDTRDPQPRDRLSVLPFPPHLPYAGSGGLGIRRPLHELVGGFDESLPMLFDVDYCIRVQQRGVQLDFVPQAVVHYRYRRNWRAIFGQARRYAEASALIQKRYGPGELDWKWPFRLWKPLLGALGRSYRKGDRTKLAWLLGWQVGRFRGSLRHRVPAL